MADPRGIRSEPAIDDPDSFYAALIDLHAGLSQEESNKINAKLILMMANQIGDRDVLDDMLAYLREQRPTPSA